MRLKRKEKEKEKKKKRKKSEKEKKKIEKGKSLRKETKRVWNNVVLISMVLLCNNLGFGGSLIGIVLCGSL